MVNADGRPPRIAKHKSNPGKSNSGGDPVLGQGAQYELMKFTPWENPVGTEGFEFIEYAAPDPLAMAGVFERMGFRAIARHRHKEVTLYRQGEINFILNADPESFAQRFARLHGPSVCAIAFRVHDAAAAYRRAVGLGAGGFATPGRGGGLTP